MIIVHLGQHMLTPEVEAVKRNASFANHGATNDDSMDMENEEGGEGGDGGGETDVIMVVPGALQLRALFYPKINSVRQVCRVERFWGGKKNGVACVPRLWDASHTVSFRRCLRPFSMLRASSGSPLCFRTSRARGNCGNGTQSLSPR